MRICNKCNNQVDDDAAFCPKCGAKINEKDIIFSRNGVNVNLNELMNKHGSDKIGAIKELRMLTQIDFATAKGVIDEIFRSSNYSIQNVNINKPFYKKWWVWVIAAVIILFLIGSQNNGKTTTTSGSSQSGTSTVSVSTSTVAPSTVAKSKKAATETTEKLPEIDKNIKTIMDGTKLTQKESEAVFNNLKSVGFKNVSSIKLGAGTGVDELQSFIFVCDDLNITVTIQKRKTYYIGSGSINLFDSTKGGAKNKITDYTMTSDKEFSAMSAAEKYVEQALKAPSTAEFPGQVFNREEWNVGRKKDLLQVESYVDSQNGFGAMIRSKFVVQMDYESETLIYMSIDGKTVYGTPYKEKK